jgi:Protein of unknown function (DUF4054)
MATVEDLKRVFVEFDAVADFTVQYWLDRAALKFPTDDHNQMLLACHLMARNGLGTSSDAEAAREGFDRLTSLKSGSLSLNFSERSQAEATNQFLATRYGRQVWPVIRALGILIVAPTGAVQDEWQGV